MEKSSNVTTWSIEQFSHELLDSVASNSFIPTSNLLRVVVDWRWKMGRRKLNERNNGGTNSQHIGNAFHLHPNGNDATTIKCIDDDLKGQEKITFENIERIMITILIFLIFILPAKSICESLSLLQHNFLSFYSIPCKTMNASAILSLVNGWER